MPAANSPFALNVADLVGRPGAQRRTQVLAPASFGVELSRVSPGRPLVADLLLESLSEGVLVSGDVSFLARHSCNRCLKEWEEDGSVPVMQLYAHEPDEDGYRLEQGEMIHLEQLFRDEVSLAFPLAPLCRQDCRGLCPTCGADLNEAPCTGHDDESGSPFAVLSRLLEPGGD